MTINAIARTHAVWLRDFQEKLIYCIS